MGSGFQAALGPRPSVPVGPRQLRVRSQRWECAAQAGSAMLADGRDAGASEQALTIDVVVLGGGPVGLATCIGLLGIDETRKVTVVERGPQDLAKDGPFSNMIGLGTRWVTPDEKEREEGVGWVWGGRKGGRSLWKSLAPLSQASMTGGD